ncbi:MAG: class I SAM-dependent methyltransferase, partial [Eubacteriales bacterium]|nr:class I SAM-dependent methyltransferase [Eubacteriales bacterium]
MSEQNLNEPQIKLGELQSNEKELRRILTEGAAQLGVAVNDQMTDAYMEYMRLLLEWNEKVNLTSITDEKEIIIKHFLDSISIIPYIPFISGGVATTGASETNAATTGASEAGASEAGVSEVNTATTGASETGIATSGASETNAAQNISPAGNSASLADIGTGAGFPGIAVKIAKGCGNLLLLDSLEKRIKFL